MTQTKQTKRLYFAEKRCREKKYNHTHKRSGAANSENNDSVSQLPIQRVGWGWGWGWGTFTVTNTHLHR